MTAPSSGVPSLSVLLVVAGPQLENRLCECGFSVETARGEADAVEAARTRTPDVVVLDPASASPGLTAEMRRSVGGKRPLLVAFSPAGEALGGVTEGMDVAVSDPDVLVALLRRFGEVALPSGDTPYSCCRRADRGGHDACEPVVAARRG